MCVYILDSLTVNSQQHCNFMPKGSSSESRDMTQNVNPESSEMNNEHWKQQIWG